MGKMRAFKCAPATGGCKCYEMLREVGSNTRLAAEWSRTNSMEGVVLDRQETREELRLAIDDEDHLGLPSYPIPQEEDTSWEWLDYEPEDIESEDEDPEDGPEWFRTKLLFWPVHDLYLDPE